MNFLNRRHRELTPWGESARDDQMTTLCNKVIDQFFLDIKPEQQVVGKPDSYVQKIKKILKEQKTQTQYDLLRNVSDKELIPRLVRELRYRATSPMNAWAKNDFQGQLADAVEESAQSRLAKIAKALKSK